MGGGGGRKYGAAGGVAGRGDCEYPSYCEEAATSAQCAVFSSTPVNAFARGYMASTTGGHGSTRGPASGASNHKHFTSSSQEPSSATAPLNFHRADTSA